MRVGVGGVVEDEGIVAGEHVLYGGEVIIRFDSSSHTYRVQDITVGQDWKPVPSVTTILGMMLDKSKFLAPWASRCAKDRFLKLVRPGRSYAQNELEVIGESLRVAHRDELDRAGSVGTQAHKWIESYLLARAGRGPWPTPPTDTQVRSCCRGARDWINKVDVKSFDIERVLYSRKHRVVGTTDLAAVLTIGGRTAICDWKSSRRLHGTYNLQLAAYRAMYLEMTGHHLDDRLLVRLDKEDGSFEPRCLPTEESDRDAQIFFSLSDSYKLLQGAGLVP
jgi:hypothetical protein